MSEETRKYIVNKSTGYELGGIVHPVDAIVELPSDVAAGDVDRGFLVPQETPKALAPPTLTSNVGVSPDADRVAKPK
jgi:hypothetical protein